MVFTLSMLRRHLEDLGHGFKLSEIKEALDILSDTLIELRLDDDIGTKQGAAALHESHDFEQLHRRLC